MLPFFDVYELVYLHRFVIEKIESLESSIDRCQTMIDRHYKDDHYAARLLQYMSEYKIYTKIAEKLENCYLHDEVKNFLSETSGL